MNRIVTFFILLSINCSTFGQNNPLLNQWEKVYQYGHTLTNITKNGSVLYTFNVKNGNYYESQDSGKTWILKIVKGDTPAFQYENFILANGGRTISMNGNAGTTQSESWVSASKDNLNFRSLGFTGSDCGWHSGTCRNWSGYKICDTIATYSYYEGGYRVTDPYIDRYFIDSAGSTIRYVPNYYKKEAFTSKYNLLGFQNGRAIGTTDSAIVVEQDTVFHPIPHPNITNLKIAFAGNKCFVFKSNGVVWTSTNWGNWVAQNIPLSNIIEIEHTHGFFLLKTDSGYFKARPADSLVWSPLYQKGINGSDALTKMTVFNDLLIGYADDKIYRSFNNGATWDFVTPQGIDNQATNVSIGLNTDSIQFNFDNKSLRIDSLGKLLKRATTVYFPNTYLPDTARNGQFVAVNNTGGFAFSKDTGQTWIRIAQSIFKHIFFFKNDLYGVNLSGIWRIKPQSLLCFPVEKTITATLDCYDPYYFEQDTLTRPGVYIKKYQTVNGCDSTLKLTLTAKYWQFLSDNKSVRLCKNRPYVWEGTQIFTSGYYSKNDTLPSGCVVFRTLNIRFVDKYLFFQEITVNEGDTVRNIRMGARDTLFETIYQAIGGCDSIYQLYVHVKPLPTSIEDLGSELLIVYPNPTNASFTIDPHFTYDHTATIAIFDSKGALVLNKHFDASSKTIDTEGWSSGVFWVKITTSKGVFVKKIMTY